MMPTRRWLRRALSGGVLAAGVGAAITVTAPNHSAGVIGGPAPPLRGQDLAARPVDLATMRGQVVLVSVWASWCAECRGELPVLAAAARSGDGVRVLGVDFRDSTTAARDLLRDTGAEGIRSVADVDGRLSVGWGVSGVPETFVVDRTGRVRDRRIGPIDTSWLRAAVDPMRRRPGPNQ